MSDKHSCSQWCWQSDNPDRHLCGEQHQAGMVCILPVGHETTAVSGDVTREDVRDRVRMTVRPAQPQNVVDEDTAVAQTMRVLDAYAADQVRAAEEAQRVAEERAERAEAALLDSERDLLDRDENLAEVRALADEYTLPVTDDRPAPYTTERALYERIRAALDAGRADQGGERA